jgi:CheY-like chemotaxis protein
MTIDSGPYQPVVLVVDDESIIADTLVTILKHSGYNAISAYDGEAAIDVALMHPPSLLISDIVLPGMNGIELAITIQRIFPDCKVILSSGKSASARLLASAGDAGHRFVFLDKPVMPEVLLAQVSKSTQGGEYGAASRSHAQEWSV